MKSVHSRKSSKCSHTGHIDHNCGLEVFKLFYKEGITKQTVVLKHGLLPMIGGHEG